MYARRFYKRTPPPDYSGVAFSKDVEATASPQEEQSVKKQNTPTPDDRRAGGVTKEKEREEGKRIPSFTVPLWERERESFFEGDLFPRGFTYTVEGERAQAISSEEERFAKEETLTEEAVSAREATATEEGVPSKEVSHPQEENKEEALPAMKEALLQDGKTFWKELLKTPITLEELLVMGAGLLLLSKEDDDSFLSFLALLVAGL